MLPIESGGRNIVSAFRFLARLGAVLIMGIGAASAQSDYRVYIDADNDAATGCSATLPGSGTTLDGMEARLTASRDAANQITNVTRDTCSGGGFGASVSIGGGYPVGLNNGLSGADVVELSDSLTGLGMTEGGAARFVFVAEDASGDDVLAGATGGGPIVVDLPALTPSQIPGLGTAGTVFLIVVLGGLAFVVLCRRPGAVWTVVSLLVLTTAWATHRMADGQVGDWSRDSPVGSDAVGDASNGNDAIDIVGAFLAVEGGQLYARIDVADVENAAPGADDLSVTLLEDDPPETLTLSGTDPEGAPLTFTIDTPPGLGGLGAITSTGPATATVDYTPDPDAFGADSFTYTANDGAVTSAPATASITITPVNDQPTFAASDPPAVLEDAGAQTVNGFATFDPGAANESGQSVLAYTVSNVSSPGLFSAGPSVDADGNLTYTPASATTGTSTFDLTVQDDGGTANGGVDTSAAQTFTITVDDVNGEPSFTAGPDQNVPEDAGAQTVAAWATNIDDGDGGTQTLTFNVTNNTNPGLFSAGPAIDATTGDLTYTPAADANGSADITVELMDDGGTANGGDDTSAPATFTITVDPVNDAPSFTAGADQNVLEDAGAQNVASWATGISAGPADESGQTLTFNVTNNTNPSLFSAGPAIDAATGDLTFTPVADVNGSAEITLELMDDGGTANGGVDTSPTQTFTITVDAVNDAPSFTSGGSVSSDEDAGAQSVAWATNIDDGDGGTQTLTFNVTNNTNPGLFSTAPAVDPATGNLTYTSALNANGSADVTVELMDDGGTANGGDNTSAPVTFTITVDPVNDAPQVTAPGPFSVTGNVRIQVPDGVDDLLAGANDAADGGTALSVTAGSIASTQGGDVTLNADGTFSYDPPAGYEGADSFNFEVCDSGVPGSACTNATVNLNVSDMVWFVNPSASAGDGRLTSPFDDVDALDAVNDGTGNNPASGDDIFLYTGTHDGSLSLLNTQRVFGQGTTATLATLTGITLPTYSDPFPATGGTRPTWTATNATALTVAQDNTLRGFDIGDTGSGTDIAGSNFGTLTVSELDLLGSGQALDLSTGTLAGTIGAITSTSGSRNVSLVSVGGTPTFGGGSLSGATNQAFYVDGGTGSFSYAGSITNTSDRVVQIQDKSGGGVTLSGNLTSNSGGTGILVTGNNGGTYAFSGGSKVINTGANPAVTLTSNTGATINFSNGGLDIDTTSGTSFSATGGGTVNVTGTGNTVDTTTGTGVNIANTTIGASGVTFRSVSADGAPSGIVLDTTGTNPFEVTGDGPSDPAVTAAGRTTAAQGGGSLTLGSGGTITNTTDGVRLTAADNVRLRNMVIGDATASFGDAVTGTSLISDNGIELDRADGLVLDNVLISRTADHGIEALGDNVGLTLLHTEILNAGDDGAGPTDGDDAMDFNRGAGAPLTGTVSIQSSILAGMSDSGMELENFSGALDLTVANSFIGNNHHSDASCNPCEGDGFILRADGGSASIDMVVTNTTFNDIANDGIDLGNDQSTNASTLIAEGVAGTNNANADNLIDTANTNGNLTARITDLTSDGAHRGTVLFFKADGAATTDVTINTSGTAPNTIQGSAIGNGIDVFIDGDPGSGVLADGTARVRIQNTDVSNHFSAGVNLIVQDMDTAAGSLDVTLDDVTTGQPTRDDDVIVGSVEAVAGGGGNGTLQLLMIDSRIGLGSVFSGTALEGLVLRGDRVIDIACVDDGNAGNGTPCTNIGSTTSDDNLVADVMSENGNQVDDGGLRAFTAGDVFTSAALRGGSGEVEIVAPTAVASPNLP